VGEPFLAEIRLMSFNFAPKGWAPCNGQLLPIAQNQALFSLLGTTFGGNGATTFALPDLRGRAPISANSSGDTISTDPALGQSGGSESHTLTQAQLPAHTHAMASGGGATAATPGGNVPGEPTVAFGDAYSDADNLAPMASQAVAAIGGSQPHNNMQPYLVLNYCIALQGIFPSRN